MEDVTFGDYVIQRSSVASTSNPPAIGTAKTKPWRKARGGSTTTTPDTIGGSNSNNNANIANANGISTTINNYYNFAFHTNNTTLGDFTYPSSLFVLFLLVLLVRTFKRLFLPRFVNLGRTLGRSAHGPDWENDNTDRITKFGEYVYRLLYHSSVSLYGLWYFKDKIWWDDARGGTSNCWIDHGFQTIEPGMAWYFLIQSAYNVDALVSLMELSFTWEWVNPLSYSSALDFLEKEHVVDDQMRKREVFKMMARSCGRKSVLWTPLFQVKWSSTVRGDFREMLAHHLVTNALIFLASYYRFTRVGSMVFLIHDVSDVPIDLSKLANFVKWKATTITCFVIMVCMWIVTRLYIFPAVIIKAVVTETHEYLVVKGTVDPAYHDAVYLMFYGGLFALLFLHVTWFLILLRIGWTLVSKGETHDYSEHKSGESNKKDS